MSRAAKSLLVFAIYLMGLSLILLAVPNALLQPFGLDPTSEVWIRVVGMLVACLAVYYLVAVTNELTVLIRASVYVRSLVIVVFGVFVALGWAKPPLIMFGAVDLAAAAWTFLALRADARG